MKSDVVLASQLLVGSKLVLRQAAVRVVESSQVGEARRMALRCAEAAGFGETEQGKVAIVATEMANNLIRHAHDGQILLQVLTTERGSTVELLSLDAGPGMESVEGCLSDGYSTGGTSGTGLGAIKRLSSEFDIHSVPTVGSSIMSRITAENSKPTSKPVFSFGAVCIPMPGESVCGDGWKIAQSQSELWLIVADGLGHGPLAEAASAAAVRAFDARSGADPKTLLEATHKALSGTRGAAVAVALLDVGAGQLKYAGIGNVAGALFTAGGVQGLVSHNGIVGVHRPKMQQFDYNSTGSGLLVMLSDGLKTRWTLDTYPGLMLRHPALIAGVLYRDFRRGNDDATVVVVQFAAGKA